MKKTTQIIAVVGPESTGKTTLCNQLSLTLKSPVVNEYSREYLKQTQGEYTESDVVKIATGQSNIEEETFDKYIDAQYIICDTDALVTKIWFEFKYGKQSPTIEGLLSKQTLRFYLLMYPDLPWKEDPLRENPNDLIQLFNIYKNELDRLQLNYAIIKGVNEERLENAISAINTWKNG